MLPLFDVGHLLQTMYSDLYADSHVYDITVEDPSASFSSLRDTVDCCNALRLPDFQPPLIHNPFEGKIERAAIGKLKLHKVRKVSLWHFQFILYFFRNVI